MPAAALEVLFTSVMNFKRVDYKSCFPISVDTQDGIFEGKIHLFVQSTKHLDDLIAKLRAVNGIVKVNRYD